jgi:hypothetical protein
VGLKRDSVCKIKGAWGGQDESRYIEYTPIIPNVYREYQAYAAISLTILLFHLGVASYPDNALCNFVVLLTTSD